MASNSEVLNMQTKKIKLFVATPVHNNVTIHYLQSVIKLQSLCQQHKIDFYLQTMKSSLVTQGRNLCVADFMNTDCTHLLFIDSDILFNPLSIMKMLEKMWNC